MIRLSVITINFNNASGLQKTIKSVVEQTSEDFEYIVIDGFSTDGSQEIIQANEAHISYWVSEPDQGIYSAMNKGIKAAKGKYCQFLNSGDYLVNKDTISKMMKYEDDSAVIYGNMIKFWPDGKKIKNTFVNTDSMLNFYMGSLNHSPAWIKRDLFQKYGLYEEKLKIVSDWKFYLEVIALHNEAVKYIDLDVTCFEMTGISNTNSTLDRQERRAVLEQNIPKSILYDYDQYWRDIDIMKRIKRYKFLYRLVYLMERILFKIEKRNKIKKYD